MADWDYQANGYNPGNLIVPEEPVQIGQMKTALNAYNSTSYTTQRLQTMTYRDLLFACRTHHLTVSNTLPYSTNYPLS